MAVLVEGYSVIVRKDSIFTKFSGGWEAFVDLVPNSTLCFDDELARVGFMVFSDREDFVEKLLDNGLSLMEDDKALDIALVDQDNGITTPNDWVGYSKIKVDDTDGEAGFCWFSNGLQFPDGEGILIREENMQWATPTGWKYEGSLSQTNLSYSDTEFKEKFRHISTDDGVETYENIETGKRVCFGRQQKKVI